MLMEWDVRSREYGCFIKQFFRRTEPWSCDYRYLMSVERRRRLFLHGYLNSLECEEVNVVPGRVSSDVSNRCANPYEGKERPQGHQEAG